MGNPARSRTVTVAIIVALAAVPAAVVTIHAPAIARADVYADAWDRRLQRPGVRSGRRCVPIYPPLLRSAPLKHTHGLHVSPSGNADNVLLSIPARMSNTYDYAVPSNMPNGLYWYHSHRHTVTAQQTYMGLAGMLEIGRPDGNLPLVTKNNTPIRNMALQYNFVFDRRNGGHQLNNPYWRVPRCTDPDIGVPGLRRVLHRRGVADHRMGGRRGRRCEEHHHRPAGR